MADISKCEGIGCPYKHECYRYRAVSGGVWQSWLAKVPYDPTLNECRQFIKIDKTDRLGEMLDGMLPKDTGADSDNRVCSTSQSNTTDTANNGKKGSVR